MRLQPDIEDPLEEQRWEDTIEAIGSVRTGKLIDEKAISDWLASWGADHELKPPQ